MVPHDSSRLDAQNASNAAKGPALSRPGATLVHWHPSLLLPVRQDRRKRTGEEYESYFRRLVEDIRSRGVVQPIIAVRKGEQGETVDGETRRLAALVGSVQDVAVLLYEHELSEADLLVAQLQANEMRLGFTDIERAEIYSTLMNLHGWSQSQLARNIHVSEGQVSRVMAVSKKLPDDVKAMIGDGDGKIPPSSAYQLSRLPGAELMREMAGKIASGLLRRDDVESEVVRFLGKRNKTQAKPVKIKLGSVTMILEDADFDKVTASLVQLDNALKKLQKHGLPLSSLGAMLKT